MLHAGYIFEISNTFQLCKILWTLFGLIVVTMTVIGTPTSSHASSVSYTASTVSKSNLPPVYQQFLLSVGGSHFVTVDGVRMHYVENGSVSRPTLLLLHGSPDNIFTWRTIMPLLMQHYHVVAPDLIGFGLSDHPDIRYTWSAETHYLTKFIEALHLHHVTLVVTDIGGLFGFTYAANHPQNIAGIALWESVTAPIPSYDVLGAYCPACVQFFQVPKNPALAKKYIIDNPQFATQIYSSSKGLLHPLSPTELAGYAYFLSTPSERRVVAEIGTQMPIAGDPTNNFRTITAFAHDLRTSAVPKLVLYANPSSILPAATAIGLGMPNTQYASVGAGYHYLAEDEPIAIVNALLTWRATFN